MFASDKIIEQADVVKLLEHYGFSITHQDGNIIRCSCKIHGGDNPTAFAMNKDSTLWFCHTGDCGGGDIFTLVEKMEGLTFKESVKWLSSFYDVDINNLQISDRKNNYRKELENFINTMKFVKEREMNEYNIKGTFRELSKFRDFKKETIDYFGVKYAESIELTNRNNKNFTLSNRLVFPIYFDNKLVGVSIRRIRSKDRPKWLHQPVHLETGSILYNYDNVKEKECIIICEGITDVWAFHEIGLHAVCTFGANITDFQYKLLLRTGADLVFAFDGDDAGRKCTKKAIDMFKNKANIYVLSFNDGQDPENIGRRGLSDLYEKRKRY